MTSFTLIEYFYSATWCGIILFVGVHREWELVGGTSEGKGWCGRRQGKGERVGGGTWRCLATLPGNARYLC